MKKLLVIILIAFAFSSCSKDKTAIEKISEFVDDSEASFGKIEMIDVYNSFEETIKDYSETLEAMKNNPDYFIDDENGFTKETYDSYIKFFDESIKMYSNFVHYEPTNVTGNYFGRTNENEEITDGVLIYEFLELPENMKDIDYDFINQIYNDPQYLKVTENEKVYYLQKDNYIVVLEGSYHQYLDTAKDIIS